MNNYKVGKSQTEQKTLFESNKEKKSKIDKEKRKLLNQKYRIELKEYVQKLEINYSILLKMKTNKSQYILQNPLLVPKIFSNINNKQFQNFFFIDNYDLSNLSDIKLLIQKTKDNQSNFIQKLLLTNKFDKSNINRITELKIFILYCDNLLQILSNIENFLIFEQIVNNNY